MSWSKGLVLTLALLLLGGLMLGGWAGAAPVAQSTPEPETECPEPEEMGPVVDIPFLTGWLESAHADSESESFRHWDEDDPAEVPTSCAKCHSTTGYQDFVGADGTEARVVDAAAPIGSTVECVACHNSATVAMSSVVFPSGIEVTDLGAEARCMQCHQGRASKVSVDDAIAEAGVDDDEVSEDLGFINIHYYAAAATRLGTMAKGGYEYEGKAYDSRFDHVAGFDACNDCHSPHTLELRIDDCAACHAGVTEPADLHDVRMAGSLVDYDGDGDVEEGIFFEIEGLQEKLAAAMTAYADEVTGDGIVYESHSYPYFFIDTDGDGEASEEEAVRDNMYASWTPRLVRAAYNYQTSLKDPGAYAHGGKYIIQLLYDSIDDLNSAISEPVDLTDAGRIDNGHFAASEEAFRHWDEDGEVQASCARCHSAEGLPTYLKEGVNVSEPLAGGLNCATCHDDLTSYTRFEAGEVEFPSGASLDIGQPDSNLCLNCHQGRESTVSVNARIADLELDEVSDTLSFLNVHYFAAGATVFGTEAKGAYEYEGKEYVGQTGHPAPYATCAECHDAHALEVKVEGCGMCHQGVETADDLHDIRLMAGDYDGDGDTDEGVAGEIEGLHEALYEAIQEYASEVAETAIVYDSHTYPYFFTDTNENGEADADEANYGNRYSTWTPRLLTAAYNYQYAAKDPGAYAHNPAYIAQALYDSLEDLSEAIELDMGDMTRPE
jgi:hypothetical protein